MNDDFDLGAMLFEQAHTLNQQFAAGLKAGREINAAAHRVLKDCYAKAQADQNAKIPTYLHGAVENILRLREEEQENAYAEAGIRKDQRERLEGSASPAQDWSTRGEPLKPGS